MAALALARRGWRPRTWPPGASPRTSPLPATGVGGPAVPHRARTPPPCNDGRQRAGMQRPARQRPARRCAGRPCAGRPCAQRQRRPGGAVRPGSVSRVTSSPGPRKHSGAGRLGRTAPGLAGHSTHSTAFEDARHFACDGPGPVDPSMEERSDSSKPWLAGASDTSWRPPFISLRLLTMSSGYIHVAPTGAFRPM